MTKNSVTLRLGSEGSEAITQKLREIGDGAVREFTKVGREAESAGKKFDALARSLDPVVKANYQLAQAQATAMRALQSDAKSQQEVDRVIALAASRHQVALRAAGDLTKGVNDNAKAVGLARHEWVNLSRQLQDVGVSLAGGQSPFMVLTQQGGQIADVFSSSRAGAGAALKSFAGTIAGVVLNPVTLLTAGIGAATFAALKFDEQQRSLERSLNGVGRQAGVTADELRRVGVIGAARGGLTAGEGIEAAGKLAATGRLRADMIANIVGDSRRFGRSFGFDEADALQELGQAFADPVKGAEQLNQRLGFLDSGSLDLIRTLQAQGDVVGAQRALFDKFHESLSKSTDSTNKFVAAWERFKAGFFSPVQTIGGAIDAALTQSVSGQERLRQMSEARRAARDLEARRTSLEAGGIIRQTIPELSQRGDVLNQQKKLASALSDTAVRSKLSATELENADRALGLLTFRVQNWRSAVDQAREDSALAVREIQARSFAEREAVAIERARLEAIRAGKSELEASIATEGARARMLAESARKVDDLTRTSADRLRLSKMSPSERRMAEIDIAERDFRRENLPNAATPMVAEFNTAATAARNVAEAFNTAASAVKGGIGRLIPLSEGMSTSFGQPHTANLASAREAIAAIESRGSGGYGAVGPRTRRGDRAYGRYQVMGENIGSWTREALGRSLSAREFLGDPAAQDAVFNRQFGRSLERYGNMNDAASVWFTGRPLSRGANARDALGTSGNEYVRRFNTALGGREPANDDMSSRTGRAFDDQRAAARYELIQKPLEDVNSEIERQRALLQAQTDAFGRSTEETARAAKQQELLNQFQQQGVPITDALRASVAATADNYGRLARETEEADRAQQRLKENFDVVRGSARDALGGMATDLMHGKSAADSLKDSLSRIADRLVSLASDRAIESIFGRMGSGNLGGGGAIFGAISKFFGFADGGVMTPSGPLPLRRYANGGVASSPQLALYGEGRTPEAYVPLPDGRSIPVAIKGASAGGVAAAPVTVNLIGAPAGAQVREQTDSTTGARRIDVVFDERVAASQTTPQGVAAQRAYGNRLRVARR